MPPATYDELVAQVEALKRELRGRPTSSSERTTVTETPRQTTIKTTHAPPTEQQFATVRGLLKPSGRRSKSTPEEILAQIVALKSVIISGVNSAGYGDKRTEFRSLTELRQILNGLEEELDELLGRGGRVRQIRMTTSADKGL